MKSNRLKYLSIIALIFCCFMPAHAETAAEYLARCSAKLKNASSVNASFTMRTAQGNTKGTLLCKGSKFAVTMQGAGTWYDGKDMWTYSAQNGEATVW